MTQTSIEREHYDKKFRTKYSIEKEKRDRIIYREFKTLTSRPFVQKSQVAKSLAAEHGLTHYSSIYAIVRRVDAKIAEGKMLPINLK